MKQWVASLRAVLVFTFITGVAYPLAMTVLGQVLFPKQTMGSLVERDSKIIGSELIAQKTTSDAFFQPRPSGADYGTTPSGASNLSPTSAALKTEIEKRSLVLGAGAPVELLLASGSGLDPHISPQAARFQLARVAKARSLTTAQIDEIQSLILDLTETPTYGFLGQARVNVLRLNRALQDKWN